MQQTCLGVDQSWLAETGSHKTTDSASQNLSLVVEKAKRA
jgi:hypothetical protein